MLFFNDVNYKHSLEIYWPKCGVKVVEIVLGHCYSIYFKIKDGKFAGGKAIASMAGILLGVSFMKLLIPWGIVMLIPAILGNFLLAQFAGTLALPIIGYFLFPEYFLMTVLCATPIFIKQYPRVIPALKGREPKWYFKSHTGTRSDKVRRNTGK